MAVELPVRSDDVPHYSFEVELESVGFTLEFRWNERDSNWYMTVSDVDGAVLLASRRVVVNFPLLARFRDERLPLGEILAVDTTGSELDPGYFDLGARVRLIYYTRAEFIQLLAGELG